MNIQITARPMGDVQAYLAESAARHRRLMAPPARISPPVPLPKPPKASMRPRLYRAHDAHVHAWRKWRASAGSPLKNYIVHRCEELGISYELLVSQRKTNDIAIPRQMIMWEIKKLVKPSISWGELGRMFGGRDHTTAMHAVKMHARRIANEPQA